MTMTLILVFLAAVLVTTQCLPNNPIISDDIEQAEENTDDQTETVSDSDIDDNDEQTSKEEQPTATEAITQSDTVSTEGVKTQACRLVRLYRYFKAHGGDHFYTTNPKEIGTTTAGHVGRWGYKSEGYVGRIYNNRVANFLYPLYRYWNPHIVDHFYTTNFRELGRGGGSWRYEGITGYCFMNYLPGINRPLYRYWNGHDHFYTTNPHEIGTITPGHRGKYGYHSEGVACYVAY